MTGRDCAQCLLKAHAIWDSIRRNHFFDMTSDEVDHDPFDRTQHIPNLTDDNMLNLPFIFGILIGFRKILNDVSQVLLHGMYQN